MARVGPQRRKKKIMLLAFQVQVLQWTGDSGASSELASVGYFPGGQSIRKGDFWL